MGVSVSDRPVASLKTDADTNSQKIHRNLRRSLVRYAWVAALLLLVALKDARPGTAELAYNHARELFLRGFLEKSQS